MQDDWYCQLFGETLGPFTLDDLRDMAREGTLGVADLVRRGEGTEWRPARSVPSLFPVVAESPTAEAAVSRAAPARAESRKPTAPRVLSEATKLASKPRAVPVAVAAKPAATPTVPKDTDANVEPTADLPASRRWIKWSLLVALLVGCSVIGWRVAQPLRFPPHRLKAGPISPPDKLKVPEPNQPSVPGLAAGVPTPLPGIEGFPMVHSPHLSPDLLTIVFAGLRDLKTGFDLYTAHRDLVTAPFGPAERINACASTECDAYTAVSPDLRELIFVRSDSHPQLMYSRRADVQSPFPTPVVWPIAKKANGDMDWFPQFIDANTVLFQKAIRDPPARDFWIARRAKGATEFGEPQLVPFADSWAPWKVSENGLRAYHGTEKGLFISARANLNAPFGNAEMIADASDTGPIDGPIWVAPQEDVIVYCSPGVGKKILQARQFWMWRLVPR